MAQVLDTILACDDCTMAIGSGDYTGMTHARAAQVQTALQFLECYATVGEDMGFRHGYCEICRAPSGNRHEIHLLGD